MSNTFASVNDVVLVDTIGRAENRLVFIVPGLRPAVANALASAMAVVPNSAIHLLLDVDAEVSRLGYCDKDFKGMEMIQVAAVGQGGPGSLDLPESGLHGSPAEWNHPSAPRSG